MPKNQKTHSKKQNHWFYYVNLAPELRNDEKLPKKRITQSWFTHFFVYYKILFMFLKFFGPISNLVSCFGSEVFSQRVPITWRNRENKDDASFMGPGLGLSSWMSSPVTRVLEACKAQGLGVVLVVPCHLMLCWGGCDLNMLIMVMVTSVVLIKFLNPE